MTDEERLAKIAIKAFKQRWEKIARSLEKGKNPYVDKLYGFFEADTTDRQKILANRFYSLDHAKKIASLGDETVNKNLRCYLPKAIEYALSDHNDNPHEQAAFMKKLVSAEYVIFRSNQCVPFELYDADADDLWVSEYPARVAYDDWYESSIGAEEVCQTFILMKSTGEAFTKTEISWLRAAIQENIDGNDPSAFWWFECELLRKNSLWIKIYNFEIDKESYVEEFLDQVATLSRNQLNEFLRQMFAHFHGKKKVVKKLSIFKNYESIEERELLAITNKFVWDNWATGVLDDHDVRIAENLLNGARGRKDRDYHSGMNIS